MGELSNKESKHFKSKADRDLWLKLCAEYQIEWEKGLTYFDKTSGKHLPTLQARNPRGMEEALRIARNQLNYDMDHPEEYDGGLRVSLEEFLTMTAQEIADKTRRHFKSYWVPKFER